MKQQDLLTISPVSIREWVLDRLQGFRTRQQARADKRADENKRDAARRVLNRGRKRPAKQQTLTEETADMREIRVSYRATFQQLKNSLTCSAAIDVEVIQRKDEWISMAPATGVPFKFTPCQSAESACKEAESRFVLMLCDEWWMLGKPPGEKEKRLIDPAEVRIMKDKVYWLEPEDFTHIMHGSTNGSSRSHQAACGREFAEKHFISTKANIEPSCPQCAEVYRKEYAGK